MRALHPLRLLGSLTLLAGTLALPARAPAETHPNHIQGFEPQKLYQFSGIENVNIFNGNLNLALPIGPTYKVGGSLSYGLVLSYAGNIWEWQEDVAFCSTGGTQTYAKAVPRRRSNAGFAWELHLGRLNPPQALGNSVGKLEYESPDGALHRFHGDLHPGGTTSTGFSYTQDGTYLRHNSSSRTVEFPDGTLRRFDASDRLTSIEDRLGNVVSISYFSNPTRWLISDGHRSHTIYFKDAPHYGPGSVVDRVVLAAFNGTTATYTFQYTNRNVVRGTTNQFVIDNCGVSRTVHLPLLTGVVLPDGSKYSMPVADYDLGPATGTSSLSGHLQAMALPTGGRMEWDWGGYAFPLESFERDPLRDGQAQLELQLRFSTSVGLVERRHKNASGGLVGRWTYAPKLDSATPQKEHRVTVTDPIGHPTTHYFSVYSEKTLDPDGWTRHEYGLPFTRYSSDGTSPSRFLSSEIKKSGGKVLRRVYVRYERDGPTKANPRLASERTVYVDDASRFADVTHTEWDGLGHYRRTATGGNFPSGGNVRETFTNFNPGSCATCTPATSAPWVLGTYTFQDVTEGGVTARTETCFEAATGFLKRTRTLETGTTRGSGDLVTRFTRDASGNVTAEEFFGGDAQTVGTGGLCGLALPAATYEIDHTYQFGSLRTSQYAGVTFKSADFDIDKNTGLVKTSRDVSGLATTFEYDSLGRPTWVKPAQEGWTQHVYNVPSATTPAKVFINRRPNGGGTALAVEEVHFDPFGRVATERRKMADGTFSERKTVTNALGWVTSRTEWGTTAATFYLDYDPFGRPATIQPPDGAAHDVTFTYQGVRQVQRTVKVGTAWNGSAVTESASTTTEVYDRQGRLFRVLEPSNPDGSNATTTYLYDVGGRLKEVRQTAKSLAGAAFTQTRSFTYDHRGFLTSERHPEKGASGNGSVTYSQYDARGHAGQVVDGPNTLRFTYDGAERLTQVEEALGFGAWRPVRSFTYATTNALPNRRLGKLEVARAYNYVVLGGTNYTFEVTETYTYGGKQGRVSTRETVGQLTAPSSAVLGSFTQGWTWNDLGDRASITYPRCTHGGCAATTIRTVSPAYTNGFLTAVPGYASPITYHANAQLDQVTHRNTPGNAATWITDTSTKDPHNLPRPSKIEARKGTSQIWSSGLYSFDGAGNLTQAGNAYFLHDPVSRVKKGRVELEGLGEGCGETLSLTTGTETGMALHESCGTVEAGDAYGIGSTGDVTLRAGHQVVLTDGFSVASGGRLTAGTDPALDPGPGGATAAFSHAFDGFGNLQSLTTSTTRNTPTAATTNRLQGQVSYDAAGNLTSWHGAGYEYDALNQAWNTVNGAEDWLHFYSADGERIWSFKPSADLSRWTLRDLDGKVLREFHSQGGVWRVEKDYIYRGSQVLAAHTADASPKDLVHFHLDHLGTPRAVTDKSGTRIAFHAYYPFGEEATSSTQDAERLKFTGHERDLGNLSNAADDLDYMHARFYNPQTGRFLRVDPKNRYRPMRAPQQWNRYAYGLGNPLKYLDPNGEAALIFIDNKTTGKARVTFEVKNVGRRVLRDFRGAGADVRVFVRAPRTLDKVVAFFKGDTVHHARLVNSGTPEEVRKGVAGQTGGPEGLKVNTTMTSLDNPSTPQNERETELANTISHEVGHELGLSHNSNDPPDLMTEVVAQPTPDLSFNEEDADLIREATKVRPE